ncbi:hypothetical protein PT274_01190 [Leuconostocaceae bacterium ESL0958]|nr:hypothetical protein [Leuconostocaceae bacterium ESL0958]
MAAFFKKMLHSIKFYDALTFLVVVLLLPYWADKRDWSDFTSVFWVFLVINGLYALYLGYAVRRHGWWRLTIFVQFVVFYWITTDHLDLVPDDYGHYFAFLYFILALFTYWSTRPVLNEKTKTNH